MGSLRSGAAAALSCCTARLRMNRRPRRMGLLLPKPTGLEGCLGQLVPDLRGIVHQRPLGVVVAGGDRYSVGYPTLS
jgi:hypothetical protein